MLICPCCAVSSFSTLKQLLRHVRLTHSDQDDFTIQCNFQGCSRTFRNLRTFENHIYMYHDVNETRCHDNAIEQEEHGNSEEDDYECEFYYDDVEMCNPLGSHSKKHKLGI